MPTIEVTNAEAHAYERGEQITIQKTPPKTYLVVAGTSPYEESNSTAYLVKSYKEPKLGDRTINGDITVLVTSRQRMRSESGRKGWSLGDKRNHVTCSFDGPGVTHVIEVADQEVK